jgi:hypothetical protein
MQLRSCKQTINVAIIGDKKFALNGLSQKLNKRFRLGQEIQAQQGQDGGKQISKLQNICSEYTCNPGP